MFKIQTIDQTVQHDLHIKKKKILVDHILHFIEILNYILDRKKIITFESFRIYLKYSKKI